MLGGAFINVCSALHGKGYHGSQKGTTGNVFLLELELRKVPGLKYSTFVIFCKSNVA